MSEQQQMSNLDVTTAYKTGMECSIDAMIRGMICRPRRSLTAATTCTTSFLSLPHPDHGARHSRSSASVFLLENGRRGRPMPLPAAGRGEQANAPSYSTTL